MCRPYFSYGPLLCVTCIARDPLPAPLALDSVKLLQRSPLRHVMPRLCLTLVQRSSSS
jgi:hypothetical protein